MGEGYTGIRLYLHDMLSEIGAVRGATAGVSYDAFAENWVLRRAVERGLEIISAAARKLPADSKEKEPHIPWRQIEDLGDVLSYNYENVSNRIVWDIVVTYLEELQRAARRLLDAVEAETGRR